MKDFEEVDEEQFNNISLDFSENVGEIKEPLKHSKSERPKKWWHKYLALAMVTSFITLMLLVLLKTFTYSGVKSKIGVNAVQLLYSFRSVDTIQYQMSSLKKLTTDTVYNQLTIDNEERRLNTYLKFKESASTVVIDKTTEDYIIYHLDCETIDSGRKFIFMYHLNRDGKIDVVKECELIDFIVGD